MKQDKKAAGTKNAAKNKPVPKKSPKPVKYKEFPIVALGGSAGSFQAFEKFFRNMPSKNGLGFVIIMHLDPNHKARVSELIQNYTSMKVIEAGDGVQVKPDCVYVIPPNKDMGIHNGKLLLLTPGKPKGYRTPIDYFFQSLAEDQWNKAVGIVFSGMGADGETGVRMIKEKLGMVMVQDPETAQFNSMPSSAISTNLVDYVMSPEEMPIKLIRYLKHPAISETPSEQNISDSKNNNAYNKILMMLRSQTGHDFTLYKKNTIARRIDRRIAFYQLPDYAHYVNHLRENPDEIDILFNELLIGVTKFFRDPNAFDSLKRKLTLHLAEKKEGDSIRVWVPGCSTGEEAYSIAIILMEHLETLTKKAPRVQIFATDLDPNAIEHARQGLYLDNIVGEISKERMERFFIKKNEGYLVKKELREMIVFAQHNIIKDAPFTRLDLLSCRNLLIYLTTELQKKIIPVFHYSLIPKGILFLGPAETLGGFNELFQPVDAKWKLSERKEESTITNRLLDFPFNISQHSAAISRSESPVKITKRPQMQENFYRLLLDNYTPASVLIDEKGDIHFINGKPGRYLQLSSGEAVMNIHRMIREELKYALNNSIHQAVAHKGIVTLKDIKLKEGKVNYSLTLKVVYINDAPLQGSLLIVFEDEGIITRKIKNKKDPSAPGAVEEMEKQLLYTKQQLNTTIEQMETSLEELKSTNEELQSTNEELQSTNEESLTTKEEMQSLNEELMTINMQYQSKAEELTQLNDDMKNLLDSTDSGTIFLDNKLDILRFTPQIKNIFSVIHSDIGRPITHLASNLEHENLEADIREVIEKLVRKEFSVKTKKGEWYNLRITPYRTLNNFISGAVLTFKQITSLKEMEFRMDMIEQSMFTLADSHSDPVLLLNDSFTIIHINEVFVKRFSERETDLLGKSFISFAGQQWGAKKINDFLIHLTSKQTLELAIKGTAFLLTAIPVFNLDKKMMGASIILKEKSGKNKS